MRIAVLNLSWRELLFTFEHDITNMYGILRLRSLKFIDKKI
jgi:hypothetical protein